MHGERVAGSMRNGRAAGGSAEDCIRAAQPLRSNETTQLCERIPPASER